MVNSLNKRSVNERKIKKNFLDVMKMIPMIDEDMSDLQPFVFVSKNHKVIDVPVNEEDILTTPFKLFSFELEDIALTCSEANEDESQLVNIQSIICKEIEPNKFDFWSYNKVTELNGSVKYITVKVNEYYVEYKTDSKNTKKIKSEKSLYDAYVDILSIYLKRIHTEYMGLYNSTGKAKFQKGKVKKIYRPKNVIYISHIKDKKDREKRLAQGNKNVRWVNSWNVRRHWRKLKNTDSFGKDRNGERTVKGYTFIDNYTKGVGELEFKVRRVN
jgi:hypothetical protein